MYADDLQGAQRPPVGPPSACSAATPVHRWVTWSLNGREFDLCRDCLEVHESRVGLRGLDYSALVRDVRDYVWDGDE
jgi:hypothetical protein